MNGKNGKSTDYKTKSLSKMMSSNEIVTLINALGLDPKVDEIDIDDLEIWKDNHNDRCRRRWFSYKSLTSLHFLITSLLIN